MIVAISREFGTGAIEIARIVGRRCGLRLITDDLPDIGGDRGDNPDGEGLTDEDIVPTMFERLIAQLPGTTLEVAAIPDFEEIDSHDALRRRLERSLIEATNTYDAIVLGRAASFVLGVRWNVVRVFMHAPRPWRVQRLVNEFSYREAAAIAAIDRIDSARERYIREYYATSWTDACAYDLTLDTSRMSTAEAAEIIISAVAARYNQK